MILLDQFVKIDAKQLERQAEMLFVDKGIFQTEQVMVVVFVVLAIELCELDIRTDLPTASAGYSPSPGQTLPSYFG